MKSLYIRDDYFDDEKIKSLRKIAGDSAAVMYLQLSLHAREARTIEYKGTHKNIVHEIAAEMGENALRLREAIDHMIAVGLVESDCEDILNAHTLRILPNDIMKWN